MLRRHHCLSVTSDNVQKTDDVHGPASKRRKLSDLIETPKAPVANERHNITSQSEPRPSNSRQSVVQVPIPGTSHHVPQVQQPVIRSRRSSPLRRYNSSPEQLLRSRDTLPYRVGNHPVSTMHLESHGAPNLTSHTVDITQSSQPLMPTASQSSQYFTSQVGHPSVIPANYLPLPLTPPNSVSDIGCYLAMPPCLPNVAVSDPYIASNRPCPAWPSFSTIGIVPAPMLATEALPGYFSIHRHHLPYSPVPPAHYHHSHVMNVLPTAPPMTTPAPSVSLPSPPPPVLLPHADYSLPRHRSAEDLTYSSHPHPSRAPPPYPSSSAHSHVIDAVNQLRQEHPPVLEPFPSRFAHMPDWPTLAEAEHAQPLFVQQFLTMLENTLGAVHGSAHHHPYSTPTFHNYETLLGLARQLSESKPKGMSKADIDRLPSYQYTTSGLSQTTNDMKRSESSEGQTSCVVCMCEFISRQRVRELPCQHIFHNKCIDKWLKTNRTCPLCRADALDMLNSDEKKFG